MIKAAVLFRAAILVAVVVGSVGIAEGATVTNVNSTITYNGSAYSVGANYGSATQTVNVPPVGSFAFGDTNPVFGTDFGASTIGAGTPPWNFQDNILFNTNGASVQASAISTFSGISNLQVRIISLTKPALSGGGLFDVNSSTDSGALVDSTGTGVVTVANGWTSFNFFGGTYTATMPKVVDPGSYILQVRGEATAGSSYGGSIQFTPVPLPAALPLLLSGLGVFGGFARRNRKLS